jgi:hypothetical protein
VEVCPTFSKPARHSLVWGRAATQPTEGLRHHEHGKIVRPYESISKVFGTLLASSEHIKRFGISVSSFSCGEDTLEYSLLTGKSGGSKLVLPLYFLCMKIPRYL